MPKGGARKGAGRPKGQGKYGEATKAIRVPESKVKYISDSNHKWRYGHPKELAEANFKKVHILFHPFFL